jgi:pimeloyl-ACP methyl ester carboxylesterase
MCYLKVEEKHNLILYMAELEMAERFELDIAGEELIGVFHRGQKAPETCIIMCHGLVSSKDSIKYLSVAERCEHLEFSALRFDFRGCGESGGRIENTTVTKRLEDLNAVIEYLTQEIGIGKLGLFGSSLGGYISLLTASQDSRVKALVCIASPFSMMELIAPENLQRGYIELDGIRIEGTFFNDLERNDKQMQEGLLKIKSPVLLFQGDIDTLVPVTHANKIYDKLNCDKDLKILQGAGHLIINPFHLEFIIKNSIEWFEKFLVGRR